MPEPYFKILQRAETLLEIGRFREALAEFYKFLAFQPESYMALCNISRCHYELNELKIALRFANAAIAVAPENEWAYRLKSIVFCASGKHRESLRAAEECVSKAPGFIFPLHTLAYAQVNIFRLEEAEKTLKLMLEVAPESAETHEACGLLALKREDYEGAEKYFLQALKINAESANSLNNLGVIYLEKSQRVFGVFKKSNFGGKAKESFLSALKINSNSALTRQNLQNAENNRFYLGSQKNKTIFRSFLFFLSLIVFSRITSEIIPPFVNLFSPYQPQLFYVGVNFIFIISIFMALLNAFFLRRANVSFDNLNRFSGKNKKTLAAYCAMLLVPQFIFGLFLAFLENDMSLTAWLILIFSGAGLFFGSVKMFQYFDNQIAG